MDNPAYKEKKTTARERLTDRIIEAIEDSNIVENTYEVHVSMMNEAFSKIIKEMNDFIDKDKEKNKDSRYRAGKVDLGIHIMQSINKLKNQIVIKKEEKDGQEEKR